MILESTIEDWPALCLLDLSFPPDPSLSPLCPPLPLQVCLVSVSVAILAQAIWLKPKRLPQEAALC